MCLIGASGSGKSTLLRCVNPLEEISAGRDQDRRERRHRAGVDLNALRRDVGIVFQSYNLFPHMTVIDNVMLGADQGAARLEERGRAGPCAARVRRHGREAPAYPDRLSGGQQQRVAIVRALASSHG